MKVAVTNIPPEFDRYSSPADLLEACRDRPLSEYPEPTERWHTSVETWDAMAENGVITIPDGPWVVLNHSARKKAAAEGAVLDPEDPEAIDTVKKAAWRDEYSLVTDRGLPVHPLAKLGVTTEIRDDDKVLHKLGMATGIGRERRYGAVNTGALLLARLGLDNEIEYPIVTELRNKKLRRSFPGGYVELDESIADACVRESEEESGIVAACDAAGIPWASVEGLPHALWKISPSITGPCTINAWLAEHFLAINATSISDMRGVTLRIGEPGKIKQVEWRSACELIADKTFLGAHRRALRAHLEIVMR